MIITLNENGQTEGTVIVVTKEQRLPMQNFLRTSLRTKALPSVTPFTLKRGESNPLKKTVISGGGPFLGTPTTVTEVAELTALITPLPLIICLVGSTGVLLFFFLPLFCAGRRLSIQRTI